MNKFVPYKKMSKKEKKKINSARRILWSDFGSRSSVSVLFSDRRKKRNAEMCRKNLRRGEDCCV